MSPMFWRHPRRAARLSAFLDGELDERQTSALAEELVFAPDAISLLRAYRQLDKLTRSALEPVRYPDSNELCEQVLQRALADPLPETVNRPSAPPGHRHIALLATLGLLITAGITLAGLRRRRLV